MGSFRFESRGVRLAGGQTALAVLNCLAPALMYQAASVGLIWVAAVYRVCPVEPAADSVALVCPVVRKVDPDGLFCFRHLTSPASNRVAAVYRACPVEPVADSVALVCPVARKVDPDGLVCFRLALSAGVASGDSAGSAFPACSALPAQASAFQD